MRVAPSLSLISNVLNNKLAAILMAALWVTVISGTATAATTYRWNATITTSWGLTAVPGGPQINWTNTATNLPGRVPATDDILIIDGSFTPSPTITDVPTETVGEFHIVNGTLPTISTAATNTLTIQGGASTSDFEIDATSFLIVSGSSALTISLGAAATGNVSGQMTVTGGAHRLTAASASGITFLNGAVFSTAAGFTGNAFGSGTSNSVIFATGSQYVHNAGGNPFQKTAPASVVVFQSGSLVIYHTSTGFSSSGRTYGGLTLSTLSGSQTYAHSGVSALTVQNDLTIEAGNTLNHTNTSTTGISVAGTLIINGTLNQSSNVTVGSVTVTSGGLWTDTGTSTNTFGGNITNNGTVRFNGGTSACGETDTVTIQSNVGGTQRTWSGTGVFDFTDVTVSDQKAMIGAGGTTAAIAVSSTDSGNNTNWTFQSSCSPSAIELASFTASRYEQAVLLEWQTGFEVDNLGFNLYREQSGKRTRINQRMIAGSALLAGPGVSLRSGRSYAWSDQIASGKQDVQYWLEEVDLNGTSAWHGPVNVERAKEGDQPPPRLRERALLLSDVGVENATQRLTAPLEPAAKPATVTAAALATQSELAGRAALKLAVNHEGWYRVTAQELIAAGLDSRIDPRMLQLYVDGHEQPFIVKGEEDGRLDPSDVVEFYGIGLDSTASDKRVYWLVTGSQPGRRIEQVKGKGSKSAPASFTYTVERRDRSIYFSSLRNGEKENFFGAVVARDPVDQVLTVRHLEGAVAGDATMEVALQGVTTLPHRVKVELNGTALGEVTFAAQEKAVATFSLSEAALKEGQNSVKLTAMGTESDVSLVDYIRIVYPHTFTADDNALRFNLAAKRQVTIGGFTSDSIRVLDITDSEAVREVLARVQGVDGNYSVTVSAPSGGSRQLRAFADETAKRPVAIVADRPSSLRDAGQAADFVIITHREFAESVKPLKSLRETQGLAVMVVDVEDIFDEFNFGEKSPQAIKDFLAFAKTSWKKSPRFALFVGDASLDPNNHLGRGDFDFVPTKLIDTVLMETASDDWFADFDGDGLAEMAVGRLPVRTANEASRMIAKIIGHQNAARSRDILLASDSSDGIDFQTERAQVRNMAPNDVNVQVVDRGQLGTSAAKDQMLDSLNRGLWIVSYFGHGSVDLWRGNLLTATDARALVNDGSFPVFFAVTCLNGYFQDPSLESLAESLMKAERGGAVAVWASSGMCDAYPQAMLDQEMFRLILGGESLGGSLMLGDAALKAKAEVSDADVRRTYILFGDPTTRLK